VQLKVEGKDEAQALVFPSPAWAARVARQDRERASFPPARRAGRFSALWKLTRPVGHPLPQGGEGKNLGRRQSSNETSTFNCTRKSNGNTKKIKKNNKIEQKPEK
jgi:hypothetical protein